MRILALEPWYGGSHKTFLDGLIAHSSHQIDTVTMSARFWKWRMHGGAVTMARKAERMYLDGDRPDLIFASSMVNLPAFLALTRFELAGVPVVMYMHENQLTYPLPEGNERDHTYGYINYLSCLAADHILFNSQFHYDQFMEALPSLLRLFPDYTHLKTAQEIRLKSSVLHLGLDLRGHDKYASAYEGHAWGPGMKLPIVLWNQRWEYDKDPEAFFRLMNRLDDSGHKFRLILAGEHFEEQPREFERPSNGMQSAFCTTGMQKTSKSTANCSTEPTWSSQHPSTNFLGFRCWKPSIAGVIPYYRIASPIQS